MDDLQTESTATEAPKADEAQVRLTTALERFKLASEAEEEQREREVEDLKFVDFDEQWPEDVKNARMGQKALGNLPAVPARPCLTINKLKHPVQQVTNQARQSRLALSFAPKSGDASQDVADAYEDIVRAIQADSRAHLARQWAFDRAAKCGRGAYRILTEYATDGDFDLDLVYKRILNQATVYLDPFAQEPDWSDGEWAFITDDLPLPRFKREFPDSKITSMDEQELHGMGDDTPDWVLFGEDGTPTIRIAEYWEVIRTKQTICLYKFADGAERSLVKGSDIPEGAVQVTDPTGKPIEREQDVRSVQFSKITGREILETSIWPGKFIPLIPVIGNEANVNGERRWTGLVRAARDAQVSYNVMRSAQVEAVGIAPKAPFIGHMEVIEGYEDWWNQANTRNFPMLPIKKVMDGSGSPLPPPQRQVIEPAIQAITLAAHEADNDIKATTAIFDPSLGNLNPADRSGKAILALQKQAETGTAGYLDNLASMSMIYEGKVLKDLLPKIYNRPGRVVASIGADDQRKSLLLGVPFMPQQKGTPKQVPQGTPGAKQIDLAAGEYSVAVKVGKSYTTRREEGVSAMGEVIGAVPQIFPIIGDLYVGEMDFPGARQIADRLKKSLPPNLQEDAESQVIPPKLQQEMQRAQQVIDHLTKELDAKTKIIETEQVKAEQQLEKARMDNETKLAVAELGATVDRIALFLEERARVGTQQHELGMATADAAMQQQQQAAQQQHEQGMASAQQQHDAGMAGAQMGHEQEMAAQQPVGA